VEPWSEYRFPHRMLSRLQNVDRRAVMWPSSVSLLATLCALVLIACDARLHEKALQPPTTTGTRVLPVDIPSSELELRHGIFTNSSFCLPSFV